MKVSLIVNGEKVTLDVPPNEVLVDTLRERLGFTGTKDVCRTGDCGSCTVLVNGKAVLSCLILTVEVDGAEIMTVEGLSGDGLHPLQKAFIEEDAAHCGYCTPGMLMSTYALLLENPRPTPEEVKKAIEGNLCRCGTYLNVVKAVIKASKYMSEKILKKK